MKRPFVFALLVSAAACGGGPNVVVHAALDDAGGQPVGDLPVRLVPYDRQGVLDSLARSDDETIPTIPRDAMERLRSLQAAESGVKAKGDTAGVRRIQMERRAYLAQLDSVRKARAKWIEGKAKDFEEGAKDHNAHGYPEMTDTTDARGRGTFEADEGKWWVVSRYVLPDRVLEWSVPVTVRKDRDSVVVRLTPRNARVEPFF